MVNEMCRKKSTLAVVIEQKWSCHKDICIALHFNWRRCRRAFNIHFLLNCSVLRSVYYMHIVIYRKSHRIFQRLLFFLCIFFFCEFMWIGILWHWLTDALDMCLFILCATYVILFCTILLCVSIGYSTQNDNRKIFERGSKELNEHYENL